MKIVLCVEGSWPFESGRAIVESEHEIKDRLVSAMGGWMG